MQEEDRDLVELATSVDSSDAYREWERRCDECLASLRERCREKETRPTYTGTLNSLIARVTRLEEARNALRQRFAQVGAGHGEPSRGFSWTEIETAFDNRVLTGVVINSNHVEPRLFLEDARDTVLEQVRVNHEKHTCLKVNTVFNGEFVAGAQTAVKSIATRNRQLFPTSDLREWYDRYVIDATLTDLDEFQERDSGWALSRILNLMVNVNKCNPMRAGSWVKIPQWIKIKQAVISVRSNDNACFAWAIISALYPVERNPNRCSAYPHYSTILNLDGIEFPMTLKQISRFERLNDMSVNVFTVCRKERNENEIVPIRLTDDKKDSHVNLLYLLDSRNNSNVGHFAWIRNLSRLVGSQLSRNRNKKYICDR